MATNINYISEIIQHIKKKFLLISLIAALMAAGVAAYVSSLDVEIETYSKIVPLSFSKASSSPVDAIKAQFGITDKTDYSVIYNIKELVGSKTLSTRIVQSPPSEKNKFKNLAEWLISDYNKHLPFYSRKIEIKSKDSNAPYYVGAGLLLRAVEINTEKTQFTKIISKTYDKKLSKEINMAILSEISDYYIQVATEKSRTDLGKIKHMRDSLKEASRSVEKLNTNVAVILERVESHDEELKDHKTQLQELNNHVQGIKQRI